MPFCSEYAETSVRGVTEYHGLDLDRAAALHALIRIQFGSVTIQASVRPSGLVP